LDFLDIITKGVLLIACTWFLKWSIGRSITRLEQKVDLAVCDGTCGERRESCQAALCNKISKLEKGKDDLWDAHHHHGHKGLEGKEANRVVEYG